MRFWGLLLLAASLILFLVNLAILYLWVLPSPFFLNYYNPEMTDAVVAAMSLGRLDAISVLLALIGLMLGMLALFGFGYLRYRAEQVG